MAALAAVCSTVSEYAHEIFSSQSGPQLQAQCRATILQRRYTENLLASYSRDLCPAFGASVTAKSKVSLPQLSVSSSQDCRSAAAVAIRTGNCTSMWRPRSNCIANGTSLSLDQHCLLGGELFASPFSLQP